MAAGAAVLVGGLLWWLPFDRLRSDDAGTGRDSALALPACLASPYLNTRDAHYVGSEACVACHEAQHESFQTTAHAQALALATTESAPPDGQFDHPLSDRRYRAYRSNGQLHHAESLVRGDGKSLDLADWPLKYQIGSGRFTRSYLVELNGFLVESPLTWYASLGAWRMSPGYDQASHPSFQRNITGDCLFCHSGRVQSVDESLSRFEVPEASIGCERCHGPGSLHVARRESNEPSPASDVDLTIVNPRRLSRELAEAVCQQCHLESAASALVRGRRRDEFRPGLRWTDFCVNYGFAESSQQMTVTGHVQQLHLSRCYQNSETMTCITCHSPHHEPLLAERGAHYRAVCLTCHSETACRIPVAERQTNGDQCAQCHMPQSQTDIPHIAFTHHRIGIHHERERPSADERSPRELAPILDVSHLSALDQDRLLGLAYLRRYVDLEADPRLVPYRTRAAELLQRSHDGGLQDGAVLVGLALIAGETGRTAEALEQAERAVASGELEPSERVAALNLLANGRLQQQRPRDAERALQQLTALRLHPADWFLLALCRERAGDLPGAIAALETVLVIDPSQPATHDRLAKLHAALGQTAEADEHQRTADWLRGGRKPPAREGGE